MTETLKKGQRVRLSAAGKAATKLNVDRVGVIANNPKPNKKVYRVQWDDHLQPQTWDRGDIEAYDE